MTYDEYIQNPMGKKNAVMSNREMYRLMYTNKWNAIKLRENGFIKYELYSGIPKAFFIAFSHWTYSLKVVSLLS